MAHELEFVEVSEEELARELASLPAWTRNGLPIERSVTCGSFLEAIALVNRVAVVAEQFNHHPDFEIHFKTVILRLWTHKKNAITRADLAVAAAIDKVV